MSLSSIECTREREKERERERERERKRERERVGGKREIVFLKNLEEISVDFLINGKFYHTS